jgi:hypothetical protein
MNSSSLILKSCIFLTVIGPQFANAAATVHLFVESADGERLTAAEIKLVQMRSMKDYGPTFQDGTARNLPPGEYSLEVRKPGFRNYQQCLGLYEKRVDRRVVMAVSGDGQTGRPMRINGTVLPGGWSKTGKATWVLGVPLAGSPENLQSLIGRNGHFTLETFDAGSDVLMVVKGNAPIACQAVYIGYENAPVVIDSASNSCQKPEN